MPIAMIPSFLGFCYITAITPGPANLCSLSTGIRYGRRVALRQWRGLLFGYFLDAMAAALINYFLGTVLTEYVKYFAWVGAAYILWLAWHMLQASMTEAKEGEREPSFVTGLLVQLTNVKVMISCLTAISSFVLPYTHSFTAIMLTGLFLPLTGPVANLVWLFAGVSLKKLFASHQKAVNIVMAISLALCAVSLLMSML